VSRDGSPARRRRRLPPPALTIALIATVISVILGTAYGLVAGFVGGALDTTMMRLVDAFLAIPKIVLLIAIGALWAPLSVTSLVLILGLTAWFGTSRLVRAEVLSLRERDMVAAARALGASVPRQVVRHILPNALGPVIIAGTIDVAAAIIAESTLSFLGLGFPPDTPTWGRLLFDAKDYLDIAAHWALFPGGAIFIAVVAINFIGDGLRDALDARRVI